MTPVIYCQALFGFLINVLQMKDFFLFFPILLYVKALDIVKIRTLLLLLVSLKNPKIYKRPFSTVRQLFGNDSQDPPIPGLGNNTYTVVVG